MSGCHVDTTLINIQFNHNQFKVKAIPSAILWDLHVPLDPILQQATVARQYDVMVSLNFID